MPLLLSQVKPDQKSFLHGIMVEFTDASLLNLSVNLIRIRFVGRMQVQLDRNMSYRSHVGLRLFVMVPTAGGWDSAILRRPPSLR